MSTSTAVKAPIRILGAVLVAVLVLSGAYAVATRLARAERTEQIHLESTGVAALVATTDVGNVRIEPNPSGEGVQVLLHREGAWRLPHFEQRRAGDELHLEASCERHWFGDCTADMVVRVPEGIRLDTSSSVGEVSVTGAFPVVSMKTSTGSLSATDLRAQQVRATASVGDVQIRLAAPADSVDVTTSVGQVLLVVPDDGTSYDVRAQVDVGQAETAVPVSSASAHHVRVTSSVGNVQVTTTTGEMS